MRCGPGSSRTPNSTWSAINVARVAELTAQGRMQPAGLAAFEQRRADQSGIYSWVVSAKRAATQERRLAQLVEDSAHGRRLAQLTRP
jgi:uncharacterized protein YdeI (YjbR/CyaY-like superfamily)